MPDSEVTPKKTQGEEILKLFLQYQHKSTLKGKMVRIAENMPEWNFQALCNIGAQLERIADKGD